MIDCNGVTDEVRAVFIMVVATVLRCYPLRADFIQNQGIERVLSVLNEPSEPSEPNDQVMEAVSYLMGYMLYRSPLIHSLLGQDKVYRGSILAKYDSFIESLCCIQNYSSHTIAAMLFALQSFVLEDMVKYLLVNNENNILSNLIKCCHGEVPFPRFSHAQAINDEPCSALVTRRARTVVNYLFVVMDTSAVSLNAFSPALLKELLTCKVPLAVKCCLLVRTDPSTHR